MYCTLNRVKPEFLIMPYDRESELRYEVLVRVAFADVSRDHHWCAAREEGAAAEAAAAAGVLIEFFNLKCCHL